MNEPKPGEKYRHFKGGEYEIVRVEGEEVIYKNLYDSPKFSFGTEHRRTLEEFLDEKEINGEKVRRFVKI